jgi:hypothetical protein
MNRYNVEVTDLPSDPPEVYPAEVPAERSLGAVRAINKAIGRAIESRHQFAGDSHNYRAND